MNDAYVLAFYILALVWVAYSDLKYRLIPNKLVSLVGIISLCYVISGDRLEQLLYLPIALIVGLIFWRLKVFAGGDVKLLVVILPSIDSSFYKETFIITAFFWASVALIVYIRKEYFVKSADPTVPFGVPLALGSFFGILASL